MRTVSDSLLDDVLARLNEATVEVEVLKRSLDYWRGRALKAEVDLAYAKDLQADASNVEADASNVDTLKVGSSVRLRVFAEAKAKAKQAPHNIYTVFKISDEDGSIALADDEGVLVESFSADELVLLHEYYCKWDSGAICLNAESATEAAQNLLSFSGMSQQAFIQVYRLQCPVDFAVTHVAVEIGPDGQLKRRSL